MSYLSDYTNNNFTPSKPHRDTLSAQKTNQFTPQQNSFIQTNQTNTLEGKVDYKLKAYKLMKQLTESQVVNKKLQTQIRHGQQQIQGYRTQFQRVFRALGARNLDQTYKKIELILQSDKKLGKDNKVQEWTNIIEEYKKIINNQQYKYIKLEQKLKIAEIKVKKYQTDKDVIVKDSSNKQLKQLQINNKNAEIQKLTSELVNKGKEISSLGEEVSILKNQYKKVILEKDQSREMIEELQTKYSGQIQHFQEMEKHVQERLIEVQRQMNYYRQEREGHLQKISLMKQQLQVAERRKYFSFGGLRHTQTQTDDNDAQNSNMNTECLEISIKTLLQQNERLKNTLILLYSKKQHQNLPQEVQLQLKILLNIKENSEKSLKASKKTIQHNYSKEQSVEQTKRKSQDQLQMSDVKEQESHVKGQELDEKEQQVVNADKQKSKVYRQDEQSDNSGYFIAEQQGQKVEQKTQAPLTQCKQEQRPEDRSRQIWIGKQITIEKRGEQTIKDKDVGGQKCKEIQVIQSQTTQVKTRLLELSEQF